MARSRTSAKTKMKQIQCALQVCRIRVCSDSPCYVAPFGNSCHVSYISSAAITQLCKGKQRGLLCSQQGRGGRGWSALHSDICSIYRYFCAGKNKKSIFAYDKTGNENGPQAEGRGKTTLEAVAWNGEYPSN